MNYFILIKNAEGESRLVPIADIHEIAVVAGDDLVVMDEQGNPVDVSLRPDGKDLVVDFKNGESVVLKGFYEVEEGSDPITISLNPKEPVDAGYEFNSQTGNLPNAKSFTLMRYSNTEYISFVEQIDELGLARFGGSFAAPASGLGGGGGCACPENRDPDAVDDAGETDQNTPLVITVLANDTDLNVDDALVVKGVDQPVRGSVSINAENQLIFDPGNDFAYLGAGESEVVSFNYSIFDGNGGTDTATVTITVYGVDDASVTAPDSGVTDEETPLTIDVLANDYDPDTNENPLWIDSVTQPVLGFVTNNINDVTFDPGTDFNYLAAGETATVTFTYTTNTGVTESVAVTVNGVNDAPDANDDDRSTDQNTPLIIDALTNDSDPDGTDSLSIVGVTQPGKGTVTYNAGDLTFDPGNDFDELGAGETETVTFTYSISDGNGGTDTATITVTVNGVDDATVTAPDAAVTNEDTPVTINVLANDSDADSSDIPLTITSVTQPVLGSVVNNGTDVSFNPGSDFQYLAAGETATVTFTYTTDTGATENVTVTINGVNDGPDAIDDARTTDQNTPLTINAISNDTDADGSDVLLIVGVDQPTQGTASINASNQIVFDPGNDFDNLGAGESATVTFNYTISDGNGGTDTATITVTINGVDDATVTAPDAAVTNEDNAVVIDVLANDSDADSNDNPLAITSVTQPVLGSVINNGSDVTFNPGSDFQYLAAGETATVTFTYTTDTGATENVTVTINGVNDGPDAIDDVRTTDQDTALTIDAISNDTDADTSDVLLITGVDQPVRGTASINASNQIVFDPGNDFDDLGAGESATVTFNYSISDGNGGTDTATITVTINGVDDATVTAPDTAVTDEETPVVINVLANDSDADTSDNPLTITSVTQPILGTVTNNGTNVTFDPGTDFQDLAVGETATVTFTYTTDTGATENVTVTINGVNDAPSAIDDTETTDQNSVVNIDLVGPADSLGPDSDPDGDSLVISQINGIAAGGTITLASGALVTVNANGTVDYNPNGVFDALDAGETAIDTFTYTISDGNGGTDTATATVTINGVEDATVTAPDTAVTNEDSPVTINVLANDSDVDSSDVPLTITSVTQPVLGSVVNNGTNVTFNPGSDFQNLAVGETATVTFSYTTDTGATENVTVTINGLNDGPDAINDDRTTDQDTAIIINALGNDTDPDASDALVITGVTQPGKGTVTYNAGDLTFDPGNDFDELGAGETETVTFTYSISDGNGGTDTATITVTVNGVDDATVTAPDAAVTNEDTPVTINVLANDSDADTSDNPLTINSVTQPVLGSVVNNGTDVSFNPGSDFQYLAVGETATVTFTYTTDTGATENVTVTINGVNDGPDAVDDARTTDQNTALTIDAISNDTDADTSDVLLITGVDQPARGTASINGSNQIVFNPGNDFDDLDAGETATVTFNYSISDGNGGTDTATITITVNGVEDATVTAPDAAATNEDSPVTINVLANDSDADSSDIPLTITSVTQPVLGSVVNNGTDVSFNPGSDFQYLAAGETATVTFTYTTDTGATENVTVTINGVNDGPDAIDDARTTDQNTALTINAIGNDTDADTSDVLLITGVDQPSLGTAAINGGNQIVFDPGDDFDYLGAGESATVTFNYSISDGNGGTDTATITVTINGVDDATVTAPDAAVTNEDNAVVIDVLANDSDSDTSDNPLAITSVTQPVLGSVVNNGSNVTFSPGTDFQYLAAGETATVTFTYTTDTGATENVTVTINGVNDGPDAIDDNRTTDQDTALVIDAITNDTDVDTSDSLFITGVDQPARGTASINGSNQIVFDPDNDFDDLGAGETATVTFTYSISDGNGGTDTATITVTINGVDDATVTAPDTAVTNEDAPVTINVLANDSDADSNDNPLAITSVTQPVLGSVVNNGTNVTFNPGTDFQDLAAGESATVTFTYTTDTGATENVTVTINGINDGPDAINDDRTTDQNTPLIINAISNDTDPDGSDVLLIIGVDQPGQGSASINASNQIVFDPGNDFDNLGAGESATVTFNYSISDGNGGTDTATITVTINGVDDATVTAPDAATTNEDSPVTIDVLANDSDADSNDNPLTITSVTQPALGSVTNNGSNVTFNPGSDFQNLAVGETATVTFTYTTDTGATENVVVTINGVNDGPDAVNDSRSTDQNTVVNIDLLTNDTDVDGDSLTVVVINGTPVAPNSTVTLPSGAIVTLFANGTVGYDPNGQFDSLDAGESAADSFTYVISDGNGGSDVATVNLTINGIEDATITAPDAATTDEESPVLIDVLANDSDPDAGDNPLTISSVTQPLKGSVTNNGGNLTFDPGADFQDLGAGETETVTFTYTTDTGITETVTVTVNGVDDPTVTLPDAATTTEDAPVTINVLTNDSDPDAADNPLTIGSFTQPAKGSITSNGTSIVFNPGSDFQNLATGESETVTFTYTTDTGTTETVTVTVTGSDDEPIAVNDADSTDQNTLVNINLLGNDSDPDGDTLTVTSINGVGGGTITLASGATLTLLSNGTVNYDPNGQFDDLDAGESATDTFTYVISDGNGGSDTATVTVTINGVEDPLDAGNDVATTFQSTPIFINALANDSDPDANDNPLTVTGVTAPALGLATFTSAGVAFDPNGDFDYLNAGESATVTFNYTVENASGDTDVASVTVTVLGSNDPTITNPDSATTGENTPVTINVLANDSDLDANENPLTISSVTQPGLGTVTNNGSNLSFNPGSAFNNLASGETATVSFTYTTNTGVTEDVNVTINGVNDTPDAVNDSRTTAQNTSLVINALSNDTDPDTSDVLVITGVTQPALGTVTFTSSNLTFNPGTAFNYLDAGQSTTVTFSYTISDGHGGSDTATVTVTVNGAENATITNPDTATTNEDTSVAISVLVNDSDVDTSDNPLTITSVTQPALGLVTHNGTTVTFNPDGDFENLAVGATATVTFTYTTNTGATENVTVTINGVNDAPVAHDDIVVSTTDILPVTINVVANDTDVDGTVNPATVDLDVNTAGIQTTRTIAGEGTWTSNGSGMVTFTPTSGISNQPSPLVYAVSDNNGATSQATIDLKYSAADVWFGNDESGSVNTADFNQSRTLISGAANQMSFATGSIAFNAALFTWAASNEQQMELSLNANKTSFVNSSSTYTRNYSGGTDIGAGIVFGTQQIVASVAARQLANHPRADVPQVMVILTDASSSQILNDTSLLADAQAAKNAGIILVFVAIQEAQQDPVAVARLEQAASVDENGDPFVVTAANYSDIDAGTIADLLNAIREAAAAGLLPPVVIDLDGDGAEFLDIDNGIHFDVDGDGELEQVAWAGNDDAVLVYDENGNDNVDGVHEISFARYSDKPNATDLDGLRHFDSNNDLILDANDAEFESFKLWQDRNGNGIVDEGEMMTLSEAGIKSIELTSDGNTYYTAGGDVKVNGTAVVNYEDGTTGSAADAEFGYRELIEADDSIEIMTSGGDVLDLSSNPNSPDPGSEPVGPDLLEPTGGGAFEPVEGEFSGAPMTTHLDDDLATAGATVS